MPANTINPNMAASLYARTSTVGNNVAPGNDGVSFSSFLKDKVGDSIETLKTSEKMSAQAVTGEADLSTIVQSMTSAELTLQTALAIREKMVAAYQDIMRMPI